MEACSPAGEVAMHIHDPGQFAMALLLGLGLGMVTGNLTRQ